MHSRTLKSVNYGVIRHCHVNSIFFDDVSHQSFNAYSDLIYITAAFKDPNFTTAIGDTQDSFQ